MADPICSAIYREAKKHPRFGAVAKYNARGASDGTGFFAGKGRLLLSSLLRSRQGSDDAAAVIRAVSTGEGIEIDGETLFAEDNDGVAADEEEEEEEEEGDDEEEDRSARSGCSSSTAAAAAVAPSSRPRRRKKRRRGYPPIARTFVVGYSWGSCVGAAAVSSLLVSSAKESSSSSSSSSSPSVDIGGLVAVSPPLGAAASLALGSSSCFRSSLSALPNLPVLVAIGDCDQFCSEGSAKSAVEGVNRARKEKRDEEKEKKISDDEVAFEPLSLEVLRGLDHFWGAESDPWSREEIGRLAERVVAWVLERDAAAADEEERRRRQPRR